MSRHVVLSKLAEKQLIRVPKYVKDKLFIWIADVEMHGLYELRKFPGYHDEPLKGDRSGQRSIRLSRAYRAIYVILSNEIQFVRVEEVSKHDY